jgi:hypothetical protein
MIVGIRAFETRAEAMNAMKHLARTRAFQRGDIELTGIYRIELVPTGKTGYAFEVFRPEGMAPEKGRDAT